MGTGHRASEPGWGNIVPANHKVLPADADVFPADRDAVPDHHNVYPAQWRVVPASGMIVWGGLLLSAAGFQPNVFTTKL